MISCRNSYFAISIGSVYFLGTWVSIGAPKDICRALADIIPKAKLFTVKEGGHMFPLLDRYNDYIVEMINYFKRK